jgi:hypothetical protein
MVVIEKISKISAKKSAPWSLSKKRSYPGQFKWNDTEELVAL